MDGGASASLRTVLRSRRPQCTPRNFMHENRETSRTSALRRTAGEGESHAARMHVSEESDSGIVPMNHSNKDCTWSAESEEGRLLIKENTHQPHTHPTQSGACVSQGLASVRRIAKENKKTRFTALLHHMTVERLRESFYALKRRAAAGVDGVTWQEYVQGVEDRLVDLHRRVHRGAYRAQPSRRVYIEKADGRQRPLGIAVLEDKIVQYATVTILNHIYEEDFLGLSYGYRPGRSQHQALDALSYALKYKKVNYVVDADIRGFFDNLDKSWMVRFIEHRVADSRILHLIQKWLTAGVMEKGEWLDPVTGTPQGSVASPLLANVYLHYVFDLWMHQWREKHAHGEVIAVRYADDIVLGFQHRAEAERFLNDLRERMAKFGLELHPEKTRLIEFGRFAEENRARRGEGKPETFDFLGFTHVSGKDRRGRYKVRRITIAKRMRAKLREIKQQLRSRMHDRVSQTGKWLRAVVQGHYNYYAIPSNQKRLGAFRERVLAMWWRTIKRRSQKRRIDWDRMLEIARQWLPQPRVLHPYPEQRFAATHPR
jgi:RNA-directed DNA polymerase